ncbi:type II toxin-antitoxin system prevent-host-death family antitoxin [Photorhabdus noenieputensis]|uniref:type II toxin-antitoxin system prevent-host-death family antitoxin n=1 Tax=Photorhabdus noenieputensis TaxID=1208607 RepID=UPI001BD6C445|nr:type II toxin-antitoxin system prevent-host-death family antitoxin [Photorhabdus noenieputensis]MBS9436424.1 type II toxin-antitoxin system prevent-host-death family antitoxin [Photorhabdus noenieputensis]MCK3670899.1 type II toxin-antitoxin system prevent-host-death family antitoxin [Photorhabdus noenieputensis]
MKSIGYSVAKENLASIMDQVVQDCTPILITRQNGGDCVIISSAEYASLEETAYLLRSSANAKHLLKSLEQVNSGNLQER